MTGSNMTQTIYRPVPGYDDLYAGTDGSIVEAGRGKLEQKVGPKGYWYVYVRGTRQTIESHRLIAAAYLGERPAGHETRHGEGGKLDNTPGNLCYGTHQQNMQDAIKDGHHSAVFHSSKTECPQGHEYTPENTYLYASRDGYTKRHCRTCRAEENRRRNSVKKARRAEKRSAQAQFKKGELL